MIYLVPTRTTPPERLIAIKQKAVQVGQAVSQAQNGGSDVVPRPLTATDLIVGPAPNPASFVASMTNQVALAANVYAVNVFPAAKLVTGQVAVIYGIAAREATPHVREIRFVVGVKPVAQIRIPEIYSFTDQAEGFLSSPVYWRQDQTIRIDMLADAVVPAGVPGGAGPGEEIEFLGFIFEKEGDTVTYQSDVSALQAPSTVVAAA